MEHISNIYKRRQPDVAWFYFFIYSKRKWLPVQSVAIFSEQRKIWPVNINVAQQKGKQRTLLGEEALPGGKLKNYKLQKIQFISGYQ